MEKIIAIGIIGTILAVTVKEYKPELALCISLGTGAVIFAMTLSGLGEIFDRMTVLCENSGVLTEYLKVTLKIIGVAYITEFACEAAKDSGEGAIAKKMEFAGKTAILCMMLPVIEQLLKLISDTMTGF